MAPAEAPPHGRVERAWALTRGASSFRGRMQTLLFQGRERERAEEGKKLVSESLWAGQIGSRVSVCLPLVPRIPWHLLPLLPHRLTLKLFVWSLILPLE